MEVLKLFDISIDPAVRTIGNENTPVLTFDLPLSLAQHLIKVASTYSPDWVAAPNTYPGIWSRTPSDYNNALLNFLAEYVNQHFFNVVASPRSIYSCYAMPTIPKDNWAEMQKVPHFDSTDSRQLATVLYLCDESFGGTGFYRHKTSGIEKVTPDNCAELSQKLKSELTSMNKDNKNYSGDGDGTFETLMECSAKVGRLVVYPSSLLHTGLVNPEKNTERNPRAGRLTITSFIQY